jgi:hypothetical protein
VSHAEDRGEKRIPQQVDEVQTHVPTFGNRLIVPVVGVVLITSVLGISRVERLHSEGSSAVLVDHVKRSERLLGREEFGSDDHGDG